MTAREYLAEIERKRVQIGLLKAELEAMRESMNLLPGISYDGEKVQTSSEDGYVLSVVETLVDKERRLIALIEEYEADRIERVETIRKLTDKAQMELLYARYVTGMYWWEIAHSMNISESRVYKIHRAALDEIEKMCSKVQ